MKNTDIVIDALAEKITATQNEVANKQKEIDKLSINDYLMGQFIFRNRHELLNDFAEFVVDNYKECQNHYAFNDITNDVINLLKDMMDDICDNDKEHYKKAFESLGDLILSK